MPTNRDTVKPWFVTEAEPTQQQFWTLFDYLRFKDEALSIDDIATLSTLLMEKASQTSVDIFIGGELVVYNADGTYNVPAGYLLEKFIIIPSVDMNISVGKTNGGGEIQPVQTLAGNEGEPIEVNVFAYLTDKVIYLNGITANTLGIFFKRKVKLA